MKNKIKFAVRILSVFLAVLFVVQTLPLEAVAKTVDRAYAGADGFDEQKNDILLYEVIEKREENIKVYKTSTGSYSAYISSVPLHYYDDGQWKDIDNSLTLNDNGTFTNEANEFEVSLPSNLTSDDNIVISKGEYSVSFSLNGTSEQQDVEILNNKKNDTDVGGAIGNVALETDTSSTIEYKDAMKNTNVKYIISGNSVKENIVIDKKSSVREHYDFTINADGLDVTLNDDNSISFINDNGEVQFFIPTPIMFDDNNVSSSNIAVSLIGNTDGSLLLRYVPDKDWLNSRDRKYPVTIDPDIFSTDTSVITDACVTSEAPDETGNNSVLGVVSNGYNVNNGISDYFAETYVKINTELLENIFEDVTITEAQLFSYGGSKGTVYLKEISKKCDFETVTYNTKPQLSNDTVDYFTGIGKTAGDAYVHFNITEYFRMILNDAKLNNGLAIIAQDKKSYATVVGNGTIGNTTVNGLGILVSYVNIKGYDSRYNYHTQDVGSAGTAYINDFTRELFIKRDDISANGNIMPISLSFMYNSALAGCLKNSEIKYRNVYGQGWLSNYNRCIELNENVFSPEATLSYYTENGTVIVFEQVYTTDENGNEVLTLVEENKAVMGASGYTARILDLPESEDSSSLLAYIEITRPDGNVERFDNLGRLISVSKTVNTNSGTAVQQIKVNYISDMSEDNNFLAIDYIEDGVGRKCRFTYDNANMLSEVNYAGSKVKYTYSPLSNVPNGKTLNSVTKSGLGTSKYSYSHTDQLTNIVVAQQYSIQYEYDDKNSNKINRCQDFGKKLTDNGYTTGIGLTFADDGPYQRKITTVGSSFSKYQIEQFDKNGRLTGKVDNKGNYTYNSYDGSDISTGNTGTVSNLLVNSGFEDGLKNWNCENITQDCITSEISESNKSSLRIQSDTTTTKKISQTVNISNTDTYTLSAMIKTVDTDTSHMLTLKIKAGNSETGEEIENSRLIAAVGNDFSRYTVQINPLYETELSDFDYITAEIGLEGSAGDFCVDSVQLENGHGTEKYDYLVNGNFDNMQDKNNGWNISSDYSYGTDLVFSEECKNVVGFENNGAETTSSISQSVTVNGKKGDVVTFGGWVNASIVYNGETTVLNKYLDNNENNDYETNRIAGLCIEYRYTEELDGVLVPRTEKVVKQINNFVSDWQYVTNTIELKGDCKNIEIYFIYQNHINNVYVSCFSLTKSSVENVVDNTEATPEASTQETNTSDNVYSEEPISFDSGNETSCACGEDCAYGVGCTCVCPSEQVCNCIQCKKKFVIEYDEFGNVSNIIINGYDLSKLLSMFSSNIYTEDGNYLASVINENGKVTRYNYNTNSGYLQSVTDVCNTLTSFAYTGYGKISKISAGKTSQTAAAAMETEYEYNSFGQIAKITHNDFSCHISYNQWGNVEKITVGLTGSIDNTRALATYSYYSGEFRNLIRETKFANGSGISYSYDTDGNLVRIVNRKDFSDFSGGDSSSYRYYYNSSGKLICESDSNDSELSRIVYYNDNSVEIYSNGGLDYYAEYDEAGNLVEKVNGTEYVNKAYENDIDEENGEVISKFAVTNGKQTVGSLKTSDSFGRLAQNTLVSRLPDDTDKEKSYASVASKYTYKTYDNGADTAATSRVDTLKNEVSFGTDSSNSVVSNYSYQYEYDDNNNITYEYGISVDNEKTLHYHYVYDRMNQLIRTDDNVSHKTYVYAYDAGGNRTSVKEYDFTLGTPVGEPAVITQTYGFDTNSNTMCWNDRLKTYNGKPIVYDLEGNPISYDGKTLDWYGKQLKQVTAADGSFTQYDYDANGLRTQKRQYTADGTKEYTVDYVWSDGKITVQSLTYPLSVTVQGKPVTQNIKIDSKFIYCDDEATPSAIMLANDEYLLVRNLQGDVIAVVNAANCESVVEFSYDPWGNVTRKYSETFINGATDDEMKLIDLVMSALCPVTYRGYNYDFTTGLYYLQSRYYNSEWGRFLNTDDTAIMLAKTDDAFSANMYLYCNNNPINFTDAFGRNPDKLIKDLVNLITIYMIIDNYNSYGNKNNEKIKLSFNQTYLYKFDIDLTKEDFFKDIIICLSLDEELTYMCMTVLLMERFENVANRKFLFSNACFNNELRMHFKAFLSSLIYYDAVGNNAIKPTFIDYLLYHKLYEHSQKITISEQDVYNKKQAEMFNYNQGINTCYKFTQADPYMNNGRRENKSYIPSGRTSWQQYLMRYGKI